MEINVSTNEEEKNIIDTLLSPNVVFNFINAEKYLTKRELKLLYRLATKKTIYEIQKKEGEII